MSAATVAAVMRRAGGVLHAADRSRFTESYGAWYTAVCGGLHATTATAEVYDYRYRDGRLCRRPKCAAYFAGDPG